MSETLRELRFALRGLARNPISTLAILLTLGLAIGANLAIFSVVRATLVAPLPYERPTELLAVTWQAAGSELIPLSPAELRDVQQGAKTFAGFAGYHPWTFNLTGVDPPERIPGIVGTARLFEVLGVPAVLGRTFDAEAADYPAEVVLSHGLWQRRFGGDPAVLGSKMVLDGEPMTVVGVMPAEFGFPVTRTVELWRRAPYDPGQIPRQVRFLLGIGRVGEGSTPAVATAELGRIVAGLAEDHPDVNQGMEARVTPLRESVVGEFQQNLVFLQGAILLALVLAAFNVAMLQLSRAEARRQEMVVRFALGAEPRHLFRLSLWENLLLGLGGSGAGVGVALLTVPLLVRHGPVALHRLDAAMIGGPEVGVGVLAGVLCALIIGTVPHWVWVRRRRRETPGSGQRASAGNATRQVLVAVQVAVTLVLLLTSGLFLRSFQQLGDVTLGFEPERVLTVGLTLPEDFATLERSSAFFRDLRDRLQEVQGVESAATSVSLPLLRSFRIENEFTIAGREPRTDGPRQVAAIRPVSPGFFELLEVPVLTGRALTDADDDRSRPVAVVNQRFARLFLGGADHEALGERVQTRLDYGATVGRLPHDEWEVVGVVGDVRHNGLESEESPAIYVSTLQAPWMETRVLVKTAVPPGSLASRVQETVRSLVPNHPVLAPVSYQEGVSDALGPARFQSAALAVFAAFALLMMSVGLYGTLAYSVALRSREIGLRMALGAQRWQTRWLVIRQALKVVLVGFVVGLAVALPAGRLVESLLFRVATHDPVVFSAVSALVFLTALLAAWLPVRRATAVDPARSLRYE